MEEQFDVYSTHGGTTVVGGGAPATWSSGHDNALATVRLLATRKKSAHSSFPAKSSHKSRSVGCPRSRQSRDGL